MSYYTYINGIITVSPMGRTQAEKRYILDTVLNHLPNVTGSEKDMYIKVMEKNGSTSCSSHDEYGDRTDNLIDDYGQRNRKNGMLVKKEDYILVVYGSLRDRKFDQTFREFQKWLCRLSKRVMVHNVLVDIKGYDKHFTLNTNDCDNPYSYYDMFENPSWCARKRNGNIEIEEVNWCEHLMWHQAKESNYPDLLEYKYYSNEENDKRVEKYYFGI